MLVEHTSLDLRSIGNHNTRFNYANGDAVGLEGEVLVEGGTSEDSFLNIILGDGSSTGGGQVFLEGLSGEEFTEGSRVAGGHVHASDEETAMITEDIKTSGITGANGCLGLENTSTRTTSS